jgi:hypothetical protein
LSQAWEAMSNEVYKQHDFFFLHVHTCIDVVGHLVIDLVTRIQDIYISTNCSIFSFVCTFYIFALLIHKSPWSCSLPWFKNLMTKN